MLVEEIAIAERELQKVQTEEDRAIRLYVSGKITEKQLDRQRKFITERLETLRLKLDDYRTRELAEAEKRGAGRAHRRVGAPDSRQAGRPERQGAQGGPAAHPGRERPSTGAIAWS